MKEMRLHLIETINEVHRIRCIFDDIFQHEITVQEHHVARAVEALKYISWDRSEIPNPDTLLVIEDMKLQIGRRVKAARNLTYFKETPTPRYLDQRLESWRTDFLSDVRNVCKQFGIRKEDLEKSKWFSESDIIGATEAESAMIRFAMLSIATGLNNALFKLSAIASKNMPESSFDYQDCPGLLEDIRKLKTIEIDREICPTLRESMSIRPG